MFINKKYTLTVTDDKGSLCLGRFASIHNAVEELENYCRDYVIYFEGACSSNLAIKICRRKSDLAALPTGYCLVRNPRESIYRTTCYLKSPSGWFFKGACEKVFIADIVVSDQRTLWEKQRPRLFVEKGEFDCWDEMNEVIKNIPRADISG